jgi:ubiquitin
MIYYVKWKKSEHQLAPARLERNEETYYMQKSGMFQQYTATKKQEQ